MKTTVTCEKLPPAEPETVDWEYVRTHEGVYRDVVGNLYVSFVANNVPACVLRNYGDHCFAPADMASLACHFRRVTNERITITMEV